MPEPILHPVHLKPLLPWTPAGVHPADVKGGTGVTTNYLANIFMVLG